jgi:hypothetical protein
MRRAGSCGPRFSGLRSGPERAALRLRAVIVPALALAAAFLVWGTGADAGLVRPGPATGPATVPHNREAFIFDLFGIEPPERRLIDGISDDLSSEGYHVTLYRDSTAGDGGNGGATIENFVKMADTASIIIINTHGIDWTQGTQSCLHGKGLSRGSPPSDDVVVCVAPPEPLPPPVLMVEWLRTFDDEKVEYNHLVHDLKWDPSWLFAPANEEGFAPRRLYTGKGLVYEPDKDTRPWIGLTSVGIAHFFGSHRVELIDNLACHSASMAASFDTLAYFGHTNNACDQYETIDEPKLFDRLLGKEGLAARNTTEAYDRGGFVDKFFKLDTSEPVVLSPAVERVSPVDGTVVAPGTRVEGGVFFDASMHVDPAGAKSIVSASGCDAKLTGAKWESPTHLAFELSIPKSTTGSEVTLTVQKDRAKGADGSSLNQWLDGNQHPGESGVAPNRDDYVWHVPCTNATFPVRISLVGSFKDAYSIPADKNIYTHQPFYSNTTFSWTESRVITVRFNDTSMVKTNGVPSVSAVGTTTTVNQSGAPDDNCKWTAAPDAGQSTIVNGHDDPPTAHKVMLTVAFPTVSHSGVCSEKYPAPWEFWHPDSSARPDPTGQLTALEFSTYHVDLDSLRKKAFGREFTINYSETDRTGGTDRVTGSGKLTISLGGPAPASNPPTQKKPSGGGSGSSGSGGSGGSGTGTTTTSTPPFDFPKPALDNLQRTTIQLGGGGDQTVPVEDEHWPDPGTLLDEICIVPDPQKPTAPCPPADNLAAGSLAVGPGGASSSGTLALQLTAAGKSALAAGKPVVVLIRVTFRPAGGTPVIATRVVTVTPTQAASKPTPPAPAGPQITSVTFGGTVQDPSITIRGKDLGAKPAPDPATSPSNQPLCPVVITGNAGLDYGTSLYVNDVGTSTAAGRYRPALNELDCIGLIVTKFTETEVDLRLGGFYKQFYPKYAIPNGHVVEAVVNGATITVHVKYGAAATN